MNPTPENAGHPIVRLTWIAGVLVAAAMLVAGWAVFRVSSDDARRQARAWELVEGLDDDRPDDADQAFWELYQLGEAAAPALISLIRDDCSATSANAGILLDSLGPRGIPYFVAALEDSNPRARSAAAIRLSLLGMLEGDSAASVEAARTAVPRLLRLLDDDDTAVAKHAGSALANLLGPDDTKYIPELLLALRRQSERFANRPGFGGTLFHYEPAYALAAIGPQALPALREALQDPLQETKEAAMAGLRRMGPEAAPAVPDLVEVLRGQLNRGVPEEPKLPDEKALMDQMGGEPGLLLLFETTRALGAIGEGAAAAVPVLIRWIENEEIARRWQAVDALGRIGSEARESIPLLIRALADDEIDTHASDALARIGPRSIPMLLTALDDDAVVMGAIRALGLMGDSGKEAGESIERVFEASEGQLRCRAAAALWRIGHDPKDALAALADDCPDERESLRNPGTGAAQATSELFRRFVETPSRSDFAFALARLGDPAVPLLIKALNHENPRVRHEAAWTLERTTGDVNLAIPGLAAALGDPDDRVRHAAGHTLRRAGRAVEPAVPQIVDALEREDDAYRWGVLVDTLLKVPDHARPAVPALRQALEEGDFFTRLRADHALGVIGNSGDS